MQVVIAQEMLRTLKGGSTSSQKLLESHLFTVDKPFHYLKEFLDNNVDFLCLRMTLRTVFKFGIFK